jgi:5'-nucleotidase
MKNILISNPKKLINKIKSISRGGADGIHILSDFDRTLTRVFVNGKPTPSVISILRNGHYLSPDYAAKAHALYNKYHAIEINHRITRTKRKLAMAKWWKEHFSLLIKSGLNKNDLRKVAQSSGIKFRAGFGLFVRSLTKRRIPMIILSSSGLGGDVIKMRLKAEKIFYNNIHIISNVWRWAKDGSALGVKPPTIHALNKNEATVKNLAIAKAIKNRKNILLLGDNPEDLGMLEGFNYKNVITVGFLSEKVKQSLPHYRTKFDILILNDDSLNYVNKLLKELIR